MNTRLLEIIKNPDLLVINDIEILEKAISKQPYVQSYRALYLLAVHRFQEQKYTDKLSETAAFTTDKKILYHLIHQKAIIKENHVIESLSDKNAIQEDDVVKKSLLENSAEENLPVKDIFNKDHSKQNNNRRDDEVQSESLLENVHKSKLEKLISLPEEKFLEVPTKIPDLPAKVYTDGELNRILFEGEENFLNEESEEIDLEATQEAGTLVIAPKNESSGEFSQKSDLAINDYKSDENLPTKEQDVLEFDSEKIDNGADIELDEVTDNLPSQLSFHGSQEFLADVKMNIKFENNPLKIPQNKSSKHEDEMQKLIAEVEAKMKKSTANKSVKIEEIQEKTEVLDFIQEFENQSLELKTITLDNSNTEKNEQDYDNVVEIEENLEMDKSSEQVESNVPVFINTWQSWLQLNPEVAPSKENEKLKAIEVFLQKEPKISRLKEESSFSVKDKGDNITHLMTETLANLYLDQRLYAKANRAFELLIEKHPEKTDRFTSKLLEIKELKNQKL